MQWLTAPSHINLGAPSAVVEEVLLHKRIHGANNAIRREQFRREWFVVTRRSLLRKRGHSSVWLGNDAP